MSVALLSLIVLSSSGGASAQSSGGSPGLTPAEARALRLNSAFFDATVPNVAHLGDNISVSVQLTNVSNESIPVVVELSTPIESLYVTPHVHRDLITPGATVTEVFWMVPIQTATNAQNVTAKVWVWFQDRMAAPVLVIQDSTLVFNIGPSPLAPYAATAIALVAVAAIALAVMVARRAYRERQDDASV